MHVGVSHKNVTLSHIRESSSHSIPDQVGITMSKEIIIPCADNHPVAATLYTAENPLGIVIIASAIGVTQSYYSRFAAFLAQSQYHAITFDYRHTGKSVSDADSSQELADWGAKDIEAVIHYAKALQLPVTFIGNSIGGQIVGLANSANELQSLLLIASSAPYWQRWPFPDNLKILVASRVIFPVVSSLGKSFPTKRFGLGNQNIPSVFIRKWSLWMTKPDYLFDKSFALNTTSYKKLNQAIHFVGFSDDKLAPAQNIKKLIAFFPNADSSLQIIHPSTVNASAIGHTGFFREKFKDNLWQDTLALINSANGVNSVTGS